MRIFASVKYINSVYSFVLNYISRVGNHRNVKVQIPFLFTVQMNYQLLSMNFQENICDLYFECVCALDNVFVCLNIFLSFSLSPYLNQYGHNFFIHSEICTKRKRVLYNVFSNEKDFLQIQHPQLCKTMFFLIKKIYILHNFIFI